MEYDTQLRLLLLGDGGAGKSSLLTRFTDDTFVPQTSTVGVDFRTKLITLMWQRVRLQLWDTNGQERFRSITRSYYRGAHGVALVFDTCDTISFGNVSRWVADIRQHKTVEDIVIIICANKIDMVEQRVISREEGSSLAARMGCEYFETSAKTGAGVEDAFMAMGEHIMCGGPRRERRKLLAAKQRLLWARAATAILTTPMSRGRFNMAPLAEQVFAPELVLRVATCIVERHSGFGLAVGAGTGAASGTGSGQQAEAIGDGLSQPVPTEEACPENGHPGSALRQVTPAGVDIMLDTALSRLEQQIQDAGRAAQYVGPGLRAKPRKVDLGSNGKGRGESSSGESCFG